MAAKIRTQVRKLAGYHLDQPDCRIKLNQNESPYDLPMGLKTRILGRLAQLPWNRYPSPYAAALREKIAVQVGWKTEGVLLANGSNVLTQAVVAAIAVGGKVMAPVPSFSLYELYGRLYNNKVVKVPLDAEFSLDGERFIKAMKKQRPNLTFIPNPNAPTGNLFSTKVLKELIQAAPGYIVIDEAYYPFSGATLVPMLRRHPQLLILRTFSKAFSLGGVRIGYLLGNPQTIREVRKVVPPFCLNALAETIAGAVLDSPKYVDKLVDEINRERHKVFVALRKLPGITPFPSHANFILFRARKPKAIFRGLLKKGILIRDVSDSGPLKNCLRVSIGTPKENQAFLRVMNQLN